MVFLIFELFSAEEISVKTSFYGCLVAYYIFFEIN